MESLLDRRKRLLGSTFRQYYDLPFYPVRAEGVWVFDNAGRRYLDAYNNVPHVGHCHPAVVSALATQASTLNTNTRYLFESVVEYADRLVATMPAELDTCVFTCTGSEANDLAWRLSTSYTNADGAIVVEDSYHGNTALLDSLNGQAIRLRGTTPNWVAQVPVASEAGARDPSTSGRYAGYFREAIETLRAAGRRPAAFFADTLFCASGVQALPAGFISEAVEVVREAGGLFVADEIQPGLGRLGDSMWGFESLGVVPDIVTLGKPMGNGHPIGAVVTRRDVLEHFYKRNQYFNTFGGNTVSCMVGLAVLEVMEHEKLQANAREVGAYLYDSLRKLAGRHEIVGEVRGRGLLIGMDLVRENGTPASEEARYLINESCRQGVLVGVTGPNKLARNVIKIRPPMVFSRSDVDLLIDTLDNVLAGMLRQFP